MLSQLFHIEILRHSSLRHRFFLTVLKTFNNGGPFGRGTRTRPLIDVRLKLSFTSGLINAFVPDSMSCRTTAVSMDDCPVRTWCSCHCVAEALLALSLEVKKMFINGGVPKNTIVVRVECV